MDRDRALDRLSQCQVFEATPKAALKALVAAAVLVELRKGSALFQAGEPGGTLYVVLRGRVRIEGVGEDGNVIVHRVIESGEVFGEISLFDHGARSAGALANEDSTLLCIGQKPCLEFLERNPKSLMALAELLARRIRSTSALLEEAIFLDARDRVGRMLVHLAETSGRPLKGGIVIDVTHDELGRRTGLHRVSVSNKIRSLKEGGFIEQDSGLILVRDLDALRALCGAQRDRGARA